MKKALKKIKAVYYYYDDEGNRHEGATDAVIGNLSGVTGNLDDCEITAEDRSQGIDISELVAD